MAKKDDKVLVNRIEMLDQNGLHTNVPVPHFMKEPDGVVAYVGIWEIMRAYILNNNIKTVLEFGTDRLLSARIFAEAVGKDGHVTTVDRQDLKYKDVLKDYPNITFVHQDIYNLKWKKKVDMLYIDDLHNPNHLYWELEQFHKYADHIMIHDTIQILDLGIMLQQAVTSWCAKRYFPIITYTQNGCGLSIINMKENRGFYDQHKKMDNRLGK